MRRACAPRNEDIVGDYYRIGLRLEPFANCDGPNSVIIDFQNVGNGLSIAQRIEAILRAEEAKKQ
jgi:hypothetical protein